MSYLPPLNALRAFDVAGRHLNFRSAAEEIGVTQGAVAQQVRQLEAHLRMPMFDRLPKGLAFTPAGRSYHARVATAFEELRAATETLRPELGKVVVSVTPTFASKWLIPNLPDFSLAYPDIDLRILATEKVSSFHSDGIDLAIRQGRPPFGANLDATYLFRQDIIAVAAPSFMTGHGLPVDGETLSGLRKLHDAHDLWPTFLNQIKEEDRAGHGIRVSQTALTIDAALSGQGVALVSSFLVKRDLEANLLVQISPEVFNDELGFYLLAERGSKIGRSATVVADWFKSKANATQ